MKISLFPFEIPFKHPFSISRDTKKVQPTLIVRLLDEKSGIYGLGETTANSYYHRTLPDLMKDARKVEPVLEELEFQHPEILWKKLHPFLKDNSFVLCAIDEAAWDLYGKLQGKKLYEIWDLDISKNPVTDYTIGIDTVENMVKKIKEFPWPVYKVKLGTGEDLRIMEALRKNTDAVFRVDANCAWSAEETIRYAAAFKELGVEFIEQPMPDADDDSRKWEETRVAFEQSVLPLIADESCISESDVRKCSGYFHGINIKLVKCGGLTPALRMIREAKRLGLKLMVGSMNESTIGSSAAAHLLPFLDYMDMDGPLLQDGDTGTGITYREGRILYADRPGTGAELSEAIG